MYLITREIKWKLLTIKTKNMDLFGKITILFVFLWLGVMIVVFLNILFWGIYSGILDPIYKSIKKKYNG